LREGGSANAIENLEGIEGPFTVRVLVKGDEKLGGSLVDAEIAGQRTLISYRADLTVRKIMLRAEGAQVPKVEIAGLKR
jgi:beta-fructofuranosidase